MSESKSMNNPVELSAEKKAGFPNLQDQLAKELAHPKLRKVRPRVLTQNVLSVYTDTKSAGVKENVLS
jgi:hypothetical protein